MHKDGPYLCSIDRRVQQLRLNLFQLMVAAVQSLSAAPSTASSQFAILCHGYKIGTISDQPPIRREHRPKRRLYLRWRVIPCLQIADRSLDQLSNLWKIALRCHPQLKARHKQSIGWRFFSSCLIRLAILFRIFCIVRGIVPGIHSCHATSPAYSAHPARSRLHPTRSDVCSGLGKDAPRCFSATSRVRHAQA